MRQDRSSGESVPEVWFRFGKRPEGSRSRESDSGPRRQVDLASEAEVKGLVSLTDDFRFSALLSGVQCSFLLDTGSAISVLHKSVLDSLPQVKLFSTATKAKTIAQEDLPILGRVNPRPAGGGGRLNAPSGFSRIAKKKKRRRACFHPPYPPSFPQLL